MRLLQSVECNPTTPRWNELSGQTAHNSNNKNTLAAFTDKTSIIPEVEDTDRLSGDFPQRQQHICLINQPYITTNRTLALLYASPVAATRLAASADSEE